MGHVMKKFPFKNAVQKFSLSEIFVIADQGFLLFYDIFCSFTMLHCKNWEIHVLFPKCYAAETFRKLRYSASIGFSDGLNFFAR